MSTARHIFRDIFPLHQKLDIPEPHQSFGAVADDSAKPYLTICATPADAVEFFYSPGCWERLHHKDAVWPTGPAGAKNAC